MATILDGLEGRILEISLLGPPEIRVDGAQLQVDTRKAIALLAYLCVERTSTRDALAALLWRDSDTERARATLRRTLSSLRSAAGASTIDADRHRVSLQGEVSSDVGDFDAALQASTEHGHDPIDVCPYCIPLLRRANDLYRGDFLEGFSVRDAPEFEDWVRTTAEHYRLRAGGTLHRLANALAAIGDYPGAVASIARWIGLDPLHEPAHRQQMLFHAWSGDRPGAVEAYRRCVAILGRELEVAPLEETTELYEAILDEDLPPAPGNRRRITVTAPPTRPITPSDLIDRVNPLTLLGRELNLTASGGRVAVVTGEPWMGKTRLVDEFVGSAATGGAASIGARGFRAESSLPFGVVVQLLRALPGLPGGTPPWAIREVCRLAPELAPTGHEPAPPPEAHGETRLFDALMSVLGTLAEPRSIIWVDDVQWCDPASASFLAYLANRIEQTTILLVLSMRSGDPDAPSPVTDLTRPGAPIRLIELGPLTSEDLADAVPDPEQAASIVLETGGIPLFVSEYLVEGKGGLSIGIQRFVESHLAELSGLERQVMSAASVLAGICDVDLIQSTSGRSEEEAVEAVERLVTRDLLRMSPGGDSVVFALEAVEHLVYEATSVVRRRLLHGRAASALQERARISPDARIVTAVARHLQTSGADTEAADWYARAGDLASEVYAHAEAETSYRLAQALGHPEPTRIRLALAKLYLLTGGYREALAEYETVAATSEGELRARAEHGIGEVHRRLGRLDLSLHHFEMAEADHPEPVRLYGDWALLSLRSGDVTRAKEMADKSLAEAEAAGDDSMMARAHHLLGIVSSKTAEARSHFEQALTLAPDDPVQRMASLNGLAREIGRQSDYLGAMPLVEEALELARLIGDRHRQAAVLNHLADIHHHTGDTAGAELLVTEAVRLFAEIEPDAWEPEIWLLTGW